MDAELWYALVDPTGDPDPASDFKPLPELIPSQADLTLLFLSYSGTYIAEVKDPWFSARREAWLGGDQVPSYLQKRFAPDKAISTLGCTEQHNFCTSKGLCTGLGGFAQVQANSEFNASLTAHQNATFDRLLYSVGTSSMARISETLALTTTALLASNATLVGSSGATLSGGLPENQWTMELRYWHSIALAHFQREIFSWATGGVAPQSQVQYLQPPSTEQDVWFCKNMVTNSTAFQSFNLVAIILIIIIGTLIIVAGFNKENLGGLAGRVTRPQPQQDDEIPNRHSRRYSGPLPMSPFHKHHSRQSDLSDTTELTHFSDTRSSYRTSSPTLGQADHNTYGLGWPLEYVHPGFPLGPPHVHGLTRRSWIAISLNRRASSLPNDTRDELESDKKSPPPRYLAVPPPSARLPTNILDRPLPSLPGSWI